MGNNESVPSSAPTASAHRGDIQGLRAIAVLLVMAFHGGWALPGGFVGVDVFFAISGFVITAMLAREWARTGTIDLKRFYLRRLRRLTPALAVMIAVVMVLTTLLLDPFGVQQAAAQVALGALALCANIVLALSSQDYFAVGGEQNPFTHTWSLSVEEQFYLLFPVLLLLGWRLGRRFGRAVWGALAVVVVLFVVSLAMIRGNEVGIPLGHWVLGFYSPVVRVWEFAAGAALALLAPLLRHVPRWLALPTTLAGLALLVLSQAKIDSFTPFPGKWTIVPIAGTVLLIAGGTIGENLVSRVLGSRPFVLVGDWSYSLYLWHWPFIVIASALWPWDLVAKQSAAVLSVVPALASYYLVEQPIRLSKTLDTRRLLRLMAGMLAATTVLAAGVWVAAERAWKPAFESGLLSGSGLAAGDRPAGSPPRDFPCAPEPAVPDLATMCHQSMPTGEPAVVVLGDSHAEHLFTGLADALPGSNVGGYWYSAPYMLGTPERLNAVLDRLARTPSLRTVVVSRYWTRGPLRGDKEVAPLERTFEVLTAAGKHVIVTDDVPDLGRGEFACLYRVAPAVPLPSCAIPAGSFLAAHRVYAGQLSAVVARHPNTQLAATAELMCDAERCWAAADGTMLYADLHHLNYAGSLRVAQALLADPVVGPLLRG